MNKLSLITGILVLFSFLVGSQKPVNPNNIFVEVSKKATPSVVNIYTTVASKTSWRGRGADDNSPQEQWRRFFEERLGIDPFGGGQGVAGPKVTSLGSGFVIEASNGSGLILTNNHVIDGADEIKVKFTEEAGEKESDAVVIGADADLDVALVKVKTDKKLYPLKLGDSDKLEVGEWIVALGNPFGHGHSVSHGIVSAKERALPVAFGKFLQVDAPINLGNSGGPLVDLEGEVVGINNAIDARGPGIGFAIPINQVKMILEQLKTKGKVDRGYIGVTVDELSSDLAKSLKLDEALSAPLVTNVIPGQPADKAGLLAYDVIVEVNGKKVYTANDLVTEITKVFVGQKVKLKLIRSGQEKTLSVLVAKRPDFRDSRGRGGKKPEKKTEKKIQRDSKIDTGLMIEQIDSEVAKEIGLPENFQGIVVSSVVPGGPAQLAGIGRGDVILEIDRKSVKTEDDFYKIISSKKVYLLRLRKQDELGREVFSVVALKL